MAAKMMLERIPEIDCAIRALGKELGREFLLNCYFDDDVVTASKRFAASDEWQETQNIFSKYVVKNVLDLGAGRGIATYAYCMSGACVSAIEPLHSRYVGIEAIQELISRCKLNAEPIESLADDLPFDENHFDLGYCRQVLHHISNLEDSAKEIFRVLKPGALFVAVREHVVDSNEGLNEFLKNHPIHQKVGGENAYSLNTYLKAFRNAGFEVERVLGSFDSIINFFPTSRIDVSKQAAREFSFLGYNLSNWLFDPASVHGRFLYRLFSKQLSMNDKMPGRMNSFVFRKPFQ